jgi:hypothetical protein
MGEECEGIALQHAEGAISVTGDVYGWMTVPVKEASEAIGGLIEQRVHSLVQFMVIDGRGGLHDGQVNGEADDDH